MMRISLILLGALAVTGGGYFLIQQLRDSGKQEVQIEALQTQIELRRQIDEAIRDAPTGRDDSLRLLEQYLDSQR